MIRIVRVGILSTIVALVGLSLVPTTVVILGVPAAAAQTPDVTGTWNTIPPGGNWLLKASGPGLSSLHATWGGGATGGHAALRGVFNGTLSGDSYTGDFQVAEGSVHVIGTMTFRIVNMITIVVTWRPEGSSTIQTVTLHSQGCHSCLNADNLDIVISYFADSMPVATRPQLGCPGAVAPAQIYGMFEGHRTDHISGGGSVSTRVLVVGCRAPGSPGLLFSVNDISVSTSGSTITAVFTVRITASGTVPNGRCVPGTTGTVVATENDSVRAINQLPDDSVKFGPWASPCATFTHTITNNISPITADAEGSTWVRVFIGCQPPDIKVPRGYSPRNCLEG